MPRLTLTAVHRQRPAFRQTGEPAGAKSASYAIKNWDPCHTSKIGGERSAGNENCLRGLPTAGRPHLASSLAAGVAEVAGATGCTVVGAGPFSPIAGLFLNGVYSGSPISVIIQLLNGAVR